MIRVGISVGVCLALAGGGMLALPLLAVALAPWLGLGLVILATGGAGALLLTAKGNADYRRFMAAHQTRYLPANQAYIIDVKDR